MEQASFPSPPTRIRPRRPLLLAALLQLAALSPLSALTWIVPGVANAPGANGARFLSDVTIANGGAEDRLVTLSLIPAAGTAAPPPVQYTIPAGETLRLSNVLDTAWQMTGTGALRVSSDARVAIFARTYNVDSFVVIPEIPIPTIGSDLPVIEDGALLAAGEEGHSGWVTQSADPAKGARTNVAVTFPDEAGGAATATILDADGKIVGFLSFNASKPSFDQRSSVASAAVGEIPVGRVLFHVLRGRAAAYTATADNGTGDLTVFSADRLPSSAAEIPFSAVSNGVAQIPGRDGAFWQTEARLANPSGRDIAVTAFLLGGPSPNPRRDLTVSAGATVAIPNLLSSLFNISGSASGAVLWMAAGRIWIATSTSSPIALSFKKGTAGIAKAATPLTSFLRPFDGPADLADLRGGNVAWTNLLLAAGPAGATFAFEARRYDGRLLGAASVKLPALGWGEYSLAALFSGVALPERTRLQVSIESGSANVQAAVVDSLTDDGVLYEAIPRSPIVPPPAPPLAPGIWGAADGAEGLKVDAAKIVVDRFCRTGTFPQPDRLDSQGRFAVTGQYLVNIGPVANIPAILSGSTDGRTATLTISSLEGVPFEAPKTYIFGMPYTVPPGPCPIEY